MNSRPTGEFPTVTVRRSYPAMTADGATALVLETNEAGTIAIAVNHEAVQILQKTLSDLEAKLSQPRGNA